MIEDEYLSNIARKILDNTAIKFLKVSHCKYIIKMWGLSWFSQWTTYYSMATKKRKLIMLLQIYKKNSHHYPPANFHNPYRKIRYSLDRALQNKLDYIYESKRLSYKKYKLRMWLKRSGMGKYKASRQKSGLLYQH